MPPSLLKLWRNGYMSNGKFYVIGIGHRAQQGKDTVAEFIKEHQKNVHVFHWAQPLKDEVMNKERKYPLITAVYDRDSVGNVSILGYNILVKPTKGKYNFYYIEEVERLHKIFCDRELSIYWGMDGTGYDEKKDGEMLQFWGTDFRRNKFSETYWVDKINSEITDLSYDFLSENNNGYIENVFVLVPDTRFENEKNCLDLNWNYGKYNKSIYLKIERFNKDGSRYYCPNRDRNHPSEIGLLNTTPDYYIKNDSSLDSLKEKSIEFITRLKKDQI